MKNYWRGLILASGIALTLSLSIGSADTRQPLSTTGTITFFYYRDISDAVPFYEDLLQLTRTMDEDWVKIYRISATSSVGLVQQGRGFHDVADDKPVMLSIVTDDVDAWFERLVGAGVRVRSELPAPGEPAGAAPVRGFVVEDPGGYTVEFFSWQDPPADRD